MRWKILLAAVLSAIGLATTANAAAITYTLSGEADLMVGGTGLLDAPVTWTFKGNTDDRLSLAPGVFLQPFTSSTAVIPGFATITITDELAALNNVLVWAPFIIINGDLSGGIALSAPELLSYDGLKSLGPIPVEYIGSAPVASDHGDFALIADSLLLTVAVPEPATLALMGFGLISAGWMRRHRRIKAA